MDIENRIFSYSDNKLHPINKVFRRKILILNILLECNNQQLMIASHYFRLLLPPHFVC